MHQISSCPGLQDIVQSLVVDPDGQVTIKRIG